jgi:hypothetical protein
MTQQAVAAQQPSTSATFWGESGKQHGAAGALIGA